MEAVTISKETYDSMQEEIKAFRDGKEVVILDNKGFHHKYLTSSEMVKLLTKRLNDKNKECKDLFYENKDLIKDVIALNREKESFEKENKESLRLINNLASLSRIKLAFNVKKILRIHGKILF